MTLQNSSPPTLDHENGPLPIDRKTDRTAPKAKGLRLAGLFAGIGGIEEGFHRQGHDAILLCEQDQAAKTVLAHRYPNAQFVDDVKSLSNLPETDVLTAGFPCQDLSQVGRCAGIDGPDSGLVDHVFKLLAKRSSKAKWLVLENVPFMLRLDGGRAVQFIVDKLEKMGWSWAYRVVDAHAFGLPQRRRRVIFLASPEFDPRGVLLAEDAGRPSPRKRGQHACGFYWTEGNSGIGWAVDAVPPLKGGSSIAIPSPPAIWFPRRRMIGTPSIHDAERLQGFEPGWTEAAARLKRGERLRWRLIGNAVSVRVSEWLAKRLSCSPVEYNDSDDDELDGASNWPNAAWGHDNEHGVANISDWPINQPTEHLAGFLEDPVVPLSIRATAGFWGRLERSGLRHDPQFATDLDHHVERMAGASSI